MKVFLPFQKELNPYLDEILAHTRHNYIYAHYTEYDPSFQVVNIHWPEAIFDWIEPSKEQLKELRDFLILWKKKSILVYTKHDYQRNKGTTANFDELFSLIERNTDVFIHLGGKSRKIYSSRYPKAGHYLAFHPLYSNSYTVQKKEQARKRLGIPASAKVIIAPGNIRTFEERKLVLDSFKKINHKNKVLIATNMRTELKYDFRGRVRLKKVFDLQKWLVKRFKNKYQPPEFYFTYSQISETDLSIRVSAADIVLVPRINILNSGNVFLGLTFNKIVVGPKCGNIEEHLIKFNMPMFEPHDINSVTKALEAGINMAKDNYQIPKEDLKCFSPEIVAKGLDKILDEVGEV